MKTIKGYYLAPEAEIMELLIADCISTSSTINQSGENDEVDW